MLALNFLFVFSEQFSSPPRFAYFLVPCFSMKVLLAFWDCPHPFQPSYLLVSRQLPAILASTMEMASLISKCLGLGWGSGWECDCIENVCLSWPLRELSPTHNYLHSIPFQLTQCISKRSPDMENIVPFITFLTFSTVIFNCPLQILFAFYQVVLRMTQEGTESGLCRSQKSSQRKGPLS